MADSKLGRQTGIDPEREELKSAGTWLSEEGSCDASKLKLYEVATPRRENAHPQHQHEQIALFNGYKRYGPQRGLRPRPGVEIFAGKCA